MKYIKQGDRIPFGLSKYKDGHRLMLPVMLWNRKGWDVACDVRRTGWWVFAVMLKTEYGGITVRWAWGLHKETAPAERYGVEA